MRGGSSVRGGTRTSGRSSPSTPERTAACARSEVGCRVSGVSKGRRRTSHDMRLHGAARVSTGQHGATRGHTAQHGAGCHLPGLALVELQGVEELLDLVGHRVHGVVRLPRRGGGAQRKVAAQARGGRPTPAGCSPMPAGCSPRSAGCTALGAHEVGPRLIGGAGRGGGLPAGDVDRGQVRRHQRGLDGVERAKGAGVAAGRLGGVGTRLLGARVGSGWQALLACTRWRLRPGRATRLALLERRVQLARHRLGRIGLRDGPAQGKVGLRRRRRRRRRCKCNLRSGRKARLVGQGSGSRCKGQGHGRNQAQAQGRLGGPSQRHNILGRVWSRSL